MAFDTSTWTCAVALVRDGVVLAERSERTRSSHAATLPTLVERVLAAAGEPLASGDAVALAIGPGSFTGLRIALSFAKGLAFAGGYRLAGVPTLDALALAALPWSGRLCAALDARKQEVYAAVYERGEGAIVRCGAPVAIAAEALASAIGGPCTFVGDAVDPYGDVFRRVLGGDARFLAGGRGGPSASAVARLAAARLAREPSGDDPVTLAPFYLRPPEAELTQSERTPSATASRARFVDKVPLVY